jgi:hypothetical protein
MRRALLAFRLSEGQFNYFGKIAARLRFEPKECNLIVEEPISKIHVKTFTSAHPGLIALFANEELIGLKLRNDFCGHLVDLPRRPSVTLSFRDLGWTPLQLKNFFLVAYVETRDE